MFSLHLLSLFIDQSINYPCFMFFYRVTVCIPRPRFHLHVFCFFFFFFCPHLLTLGDRFYCCEQCIHCSHTVYSLFTYLKNIKNRSHDTIYTFKNYFATVFSVFSNNKLNPNGPKACIIRTLLRGRSSKSSYVSLI